MGGNETSPGPIETPIYDTLGTAVEQNAGFMDMTAGTVPGTRIGSAD